MVSDEFGHSIFYFGYKSAVGDGGGGGGGWRGVGVGLLEKYSTQI